jgi:hypothetical protein
MESKTTKPPALTGGLLFYQNNSYLLMDFADL